MKSKHKFYLRMTPVFLVLVAALPGWSMGLAWKEAPDFRLTDHRGVSHQLHRYVDKQVILLAAWQEDCSELEGLTKSLEGAAEAFDASATAFFWISPIEAERYTVALERAQALAGAIPVLLDEVHWVSQALGFQNVGDAVVVEVDGWNIVHRGNLIQEGGVQAISGAIQTVLDGGAVVEPAPASSEKPCSLRLAEPPSEVSYSEDIAPILAKHCVACHSKGNGAPFEFSSAKRAQGWAKMTAEVLRTKRMPPWSADPHIGIFKNSRALSVGEERALNAWIDQGAKVAEGEMDLLATLEPPQAREWKLGNPDLVLAFEKPEVIPAEGIQKYRHIHVKSNLEEDRWLRGADIRPGNVRVVHHVLVFMKYPSDKEWMQYDPVDGMRSYTAGFVQGKEPAFFPEGTGVYVPAGTEFMFQMHYTASGKEETDQTELGLYFHEGRPERELLLRSAFHIQFEIPPHAGDYEVSAKHLVKQDSMLYYMTPHMHFRGSRMRYEAIFPGGERQTLLSVVNYDFNWQHRYELAEPVFLPKGTQIECTGAFDNSVRNVYNPDPEQVVTFGQQTWDEMYIGYIAYAPVAPIPDRDYRRY